MPRRMVLLLALAGVACQAAAPAALSDADVAAIHALGAAFDSAARAGDAGTFLALFTDDAVFLPPNGAAVQGRAAFDPWITSAVGMFTFTEHAMRLTRIEGAGDVAWVSGTFSETFQMAGAPAAISDTGKVAFLARRQPDGTWRFAAEIWNSDLPLPAPPPGH